VGDPGSVAGVYERGEGMTIKQAIFEVSLYAVAFFGATAAMQMFW